MLEIISSQPRCAHGYCWGRAGGQDTLRLTISMLNLCALLALGAWVHFNGMPHWTTNAGAILIGSTALFSLNLGFLALSGQRHSPAMGNSPGYANTLAAIRESRASSIDALRRSSMQALYDAASPLGALSAERLTEAAGLLQRRGEYDKALEQLADAPVAREILSLANHVNTTPDDDAIIRLEGLLAFIHSREPDEGTLEILESVDVRLDALYPDEAFDPPTVDPSGGSAPSAPSAQAAAPLRDINYEDVVNATLRIVPLEKISGLALSERRALFSRVRSIMQKTGNLPDASEISEIETWVAANSH